jgi:predicted dehydrogenase
MKKIRQEKIDRRKFLKRSGVILASSLFAAPSIVPASVFGANSPANRITIGSIGTGGMGTNNLRGFLNQPAAQVVAVCDVDRSHRESARELAGLPEKDAYNDFRELLSRDDIDAVVVATPDHWHVPISIEAAKANKDIYCEKPLTLTIEEGRRLVQTVRKYDRVLQTGSQQRSGNRFRFACELVRNGCIGELKTMHVEIPGNNRENPLNWKIEPVPQGFDYEMWLGPAKWEPYTEMRCHYTFRFILDYSGGQMTNWGAHYLDIAQWGVGADDSGPVEIEGQGEFPTDGLFNTALKSYVEYTYGNGVKLILKTGGAGIRFEGTEGSVYVDREKIESDPKSLVKIKLDPNGISLYRSNDHQGNFLECIKLRKDPIANVEVGHRSATLCHLGNIAQLTGRKLFWDPRAEKFLNDPVANDYLKANVRSPYNFG